MRFQVSVPALVLAAIFAPAAAGQVSYDLDLEAPGPVGPVEVDVEEIELAIAWRIACTPEASPGAPATGPVQLRWDPPAPASPGLIIQGEQEAQVEVPDCATTMETEGTHPFVVAGTQQAPGLTPIDIRFNATLTWGPQPWEVTAMATGQAILGYVGLLDADALIRIKEAGPGETSDWTTRITNLGNAPTYVLVSADDDRVEAPERWPDDPLAAGEVGVLEVLYHHPDGAGWNNDEAAFRLTLTPVAAEDETLQGEAVVTSSLARTRGVPAGGLPVLAAAVGLLLIRRR